MNEQVDNIENWIKKINKAEGCYQKYYGVIKKTRDAYKGKGLSFAGEEKYNIFWSSVETLKPFLYFKQPKPFIQRKGQNNGEAERLACKILENALEWDLEQFDFDSVIKYARNDFLISGLGLVWEQYKPEFIEIANPETVSGKEEENNQGGFWAIKTGEKVESVYIDPANFICDCDKVGIWEDVEWIARKVYMNRAKAIECFGLAAENLFPAILAERNDGREICIYEIWDKPSRKVYWLSKEAPSAFLRVSDDPLKLSGFFPCPKPIMATVTNDSIIPEPDYCMIQGMINELNGITTRMRLTMQALKVSGAYDKSFPELHSILDKDITLVAVSDFQKLKDCGGIRGIIDFAPIEQYIAALEALARRRDDIVEDIFEVTGVSDIMRGNSNVAETATAVAKKTNFGTLRNQDRQNDMQRFIRDLYKIKAEIICEQFSTDVLASFLSEEERENTAVVYQAIALLREDKMRGMVLGIETDTVINQEEENAKVMNGINAVNGLIASAFDKVSSQPALLPLYKQMIHVVVSSLPKARQFEGVLDMVFDEVERELNKPEVGVQPLLQNNPQMDLAHKQLDMNYEINREKNMLKARELDLKEREQNLETVKEFNKGNK